MDITRHNIAPASASILLSCILAAGFLFTSPLPAAAGKTPESAAAEKELPKVLIIGDSISIGYTPHVKRLLEGRAMVLRHKGNAGPSIRAEEKIESWLGDTQWDVIHFNVGLWDMYGWEYANQDRSPPRYAARLDKLIRRLKKTGAEVIWGTTTPACPEPEVSMRDRFDALVTLSPKEEQTYLDTAEGVMRKHGITINDLHGPMAEHWDRFSIGPDNVHFNEAGYAELGRLVANAIAKKLPATKPAAE